jgi:hypothetical protein
MRRDYLPGDSKTKAGLLRTALRDKKRLKDMLEPFGLDPATGIRERQFNSFVLCTVAYDKFLPPVRIGSVERHADDACNFTVFVPQR